MTLFHGAFSPIVHGAIFDDGEEPRRQPDGIDGVLMPKELQEGFAGDVFRQFPIANRPQCVLENRIDVGPVSLFKVCHLHYVKGRTSGIRLSRLSLSRAPPGALPPSVYQGPDGTMGTYP